MSSNRPLHIAVALGGTEPSGPDASPLTARQWVEQIADAERGLLDLVTIEDSHRGGARLDAIMIACRVAPATGHIGIVPMASTTLTEPFLLSSQIATLDFVSGGRAGWQIEVLTDPDAAGYVGPRAMPDGDARFEEAAHHVEIVRRLWDSWDDDAEIRDAATNRFIDRGRVHHIDYDAPGLAIRGPSITPRPPQGQPIVAIRVDSDATRSLAALSADVVFLAVAAVEDLGPNADAARTAAAAAGRDPAQLRLLADVDVALGADRDVAHGRLAVTGSAAEIADRLIEWSEAGVDGFRLRPATIAQDLPAITGPLADALLTRGVLRNAYRQSTLRGLLGLDLPAARYAIA